KARREEKRMQKEKRIHRQKQKKAEREQEREESRVRREIQKEEEKLRRSLANPQLEKVDTGTHHNRKRSVHNKKVQEDSQDLLPMTWAATYLPIKKIKNGIIYTEDGRYVKMLEILPINFLLRSPSEQRNIVFSFLSYLKIAPIRMQFKIVSKKTDIAEYLE